MKIHVRDFRDWIENCTNGDDKCETSSIHVINMYLEMIKREIHREVSRVVK